jgi:hypothetical protein
MYLRLAVSYLISICEIEATVGTHTTKQLLRLPTLGHYNGAA